MNSITYGVRAAIMAGLGLFMATSVLAFTTPASAQEVIINEAPTEAVVEAVEPVTATDVLETASVLEEAPVVEEAPAAPAPEAVVDEAQAPAPEVAPAPEPAPEVLGESAAAEEVAEVAPVAAPELGTEEADYHPGETASIWGKLFGSFQTIILKIFGSDENDQNYVEETQTLETDAEGNVSTTYQLDDLYRPFYEMVASTLDGTVLAEAWFRDSAVGTYDQCANADGEGGVAGECDWINGNLNKNNSTYYEGDSTVQRVWLKGYGPNEEHTVTFHYGTTKAGKHAYDFLTSWDHSESWIPESNLCEGITGCEAAVANTGAIPQDPAADGYDNFARAFEIRGGAITGVSIPALASGSYAGDSDTAVTVTFVTDGVGGDMCTTTGQGVNAVTTCNVAIFFGAHVSDSDDWAPELTAIDIPGSPYHVQLAAEDGESIGKRDNQMQTDAIVVPSLGMLTLQKTVVNDNGGTAVDTDWTLAANGPTPISGVEGDPAVTAAPVLAGVYTLSESGGPTGYAAGDWSCTGGVLNGSQLTLLASESATCVITNNDEPGHLIVHKVTVPASDTTTQFSITASGGTIVSPAATQPIVGGGSVDYTVNAGIYSVSEADLAGWSETSNTCADVVVANGETEECTITNTKLGTVVIVKDVIGNPDPTNFTFQNNFGNGHPASFMLDEDNNGDLPSSRSFDVLPGTYAVSEDALTGWQQEGATCTDSSPVGAIAVAPGETVTCTFVNEELISITLVKNTVGGDGAFDFDATGADLPVDIDLTTVGGTAAQTFTGLDQDNTFSIAENVPAGWALVSATCTGGNTPASITPEPGEDVTCTFTNNKPAAQIDLTPLTATNAIGDDHVITAAVQSHNGNGSWAPAADGTLVTFSVTNSNGATAAFVGGNTCVTAAGSCSVTINSPTTGSVAIHASASPTVLGVAVPVATGTGGDNSADAQKDYVNARISITPLVDVNEVNDDHEFVVTVEKDTGSGFVALEGAMVDVNVSPAADSLDESDCADGTNAGGQCTATINSDSAGVFTATASSTVNVSGVVFNLLTNALNGNSAAAQKTYVDASIALTPQEGINDITDPHEITATVKKDEGSGLVAAVGETVTFSVTLGTAEFVGGVNTCVTDALGVCSISIVDDMPGDNEVDASVSVTAGGLELARSTSGNAGPGGSDEAKKTYVAGALSVTKVVAGLAGVVNGATVDDTFTVTVTGPSYPSGHQIVFTLTDGVLANPNPVELINLIPGNYTVTEADAGTEWTETVPANAVAVVANQTASATVTNTYVPGSLELSKVVQLNNYVFPNTVDTSFTFEVTGPSYPVAETVVINVVDGVPAGAETLENLIPGNYTVTEVGENTTAWTASGEGAVSVTAGAKATKAVTNSLKIPNTNITVTPSVFETEPGQNVVLTITDTNTGATPIENPSVELLANNVLVNPQPSYVSGDVNDNDTMDIGETWTWSASALIEVNTTFTVNGKGTDPLGNPVEAPQYPTEAKSITVKVIGTTRTIGFWQTHTNFTKYVASSTTLFVGVNQPVGPATHKGTLVNYGQVFGGFYAPIAKTTTGVKRTPIDQARVQMLQQLLAAKLNCAAFGCSTATQNLIAQADAAYKDGLNKNLILSLAGQLDTYNNSGDAGAIPSGLPATGKATPKVSQALANLSFWNQP